MQFDTVMRQNYGRAVTVDGNKTGHAAEHITGLKRVIPAGLEVNTKIGSEKGPKVSFVDRVMFALEKEETIIERLIGYGLCFLVLLYLLGSVARAVFF
ncbi:hypothetical protein [Desulfallas thermosapovorans]|uniref:Uncharacterized protein n=1 Tax=Desulfallas thermosapovorans DSM 6562 TaxID=1121431 RepID=A0A5S4ZN43_9FIRM|nr:hypothetical protein [Desulfallas thermosapovorans]TYO93363.1 hypothetical protein LX24_02693 [Desulfallas thermosapovorans DSM 6562]